VPKCSSGSGACTRRRFRSTSQYVIQMRAEDVIVAVLSDSPGHRHDAVPMTGVPPFHPLGHLDMAGSYG
jgi:hypothetical protein